MKRNIGRMALISMVTSLLLIFAFSLCAFAQRDDGPPAHNFSGTWDLRQSNGFVVTMVLTQNGREITGTASYNAGRNGIARGSVSGRAWRTNGGGGWQTNVDNFQVEIAWNGAVGVYRATASWADGVLHGETYQKNNPGARASWTAGPFARRR
ncbi:MAG: hypothetical protein JO053_07355 [Acidobacteria bacterium]|nr:hypothetical protein [Acidobacteriota bacterium]